MACACWSPSAGRVDLEGKPAGVVSADDEKHAKAKQAGIRTRRGRPFFEYTLGDEILDFFVERQVNVIVPAIGGRRLKTFC
jgi:hypothetical protein